MEPVEILAVATTVLVTSLGLFATAKKMVESSYRTQIEGLKYHISILESESVKLDSRAKAAEDTIESINHGNKGNAELLNELKKAVNAIEKLQDGHIKAT